MNGPHELNQLLTRIHNIRHKRADKIKKSLENSRPTPKTPLSPIFIIDIDGTLLDNYPRQQAIFRNELAVKFPHLQNSNLMEEITRPTSLQYSIMDLIANYVCDSSLLASIKGTFMQNFLSDRYLSCDTPLPDAISSVNRLLGRQIYVLLLTGRTKGAMLEGTINRLKMAGLHVQSPYLFLQMKEDAEQDDLAFKTSVFYVLQEKLSDYRLIIIDNESKICQYAQETNPQAIVVHFQTSQSRQVPFLGYKLFSWNKMQSALRKVLPNFI